MPARAHTRCLPWRASDESAAPRFAVEFLSGSHSGIHTGALVRVARPGVLLWDPKPDNQLGSPYAPEEGVRHAAVGSACPASSELKKPTARLFFSALIFLPCPGCGTAGPRILPRTPRGRGPPCQIREALWFQMCGWSCPRPGASPTRGRRRTSLAQFSSRVHVAVMLRTVPTFIKPSPD